ncbi:MAG: alpha-galactosidase [Muribaculaceae bacterium]|nr:alpha-galactosidase [Muribaculaceae bacterium]
MKRTLILMAAVASLCLNMAAHDRYIAIATDHVSLIYRVGDNGRLYQSYLGPRLTHESDYAGLPGGIEAYLTHGMEDYFEPALHVEHPDGNHSTELKYVSHQVSAAADGSTCTAITLADDQYPTTVRLLLNAYAAQDVIVAHTEIVNADKRPVTLHKYASSLLSMNRSRYFLTEYSGDWASEVNMSESELQFGKKVLDTKLGSRASMFMPSFFQLSLDGHSSETQGDVLVGTLAWTGNYRFTFEVDQNGLLRLISGINPYFSAYQLKAGETFTTPDFIFTYSTQGRGQASRNLHSWARQYRLKNGSGDRMTLLNNWEATFFDFDEQKLVGLMDDAVRLGVDMFLLDDGWFGNKYPRSSDHQGLGDWQETASKLPHKVGYLCEQAAKKGIKFGIWIEPEMVNPKSELYEKHKDWVIHLPNRKEYYFRNQMVLDLSNPQVQDHVFGVVDRLMTAYPQIAFFKWDCNSPITNIFSPYLKDKQSHLYVDYVRGLYKVLERIRAKYPDLPMMLCSGGGGRIDYEALRYFTEFWPSDNTDPVERLYIQYGFSSVYPAKAQCAHVTTWNKEASIKFRVDVASMGKLGFDIKCSDLKDDEIKFCREAIGNYNRLKPVILDGDMYRLVSPYEGNHASTMMVSGGKDRAVVFAFDVNPRYREHLLPVKLQGLDSNRQYRVAEINRIGGWPLGCDGKTYSGEYLMTVGLPLFGTTRLTSHVLELVAM